MDIHLQARNAAIGIALAMLVSCGGGGGGGGGGTPPLQYSGNTSPAVITTSNAAALTANVVGGTDIAQATSSVDSRDQANSAHGAIHLSRWLTSVFRDTLGRQTSLDGGLTSVPMDSGLPCDNGGTARVVGDVDPMSGRGTATVTYTNCQVGQDVMNGQATMRIDAAVTGAMFTPTDFTISFERLTLRGTVNTDIRGSVRVVVNIFVNTETSTENVVALYNNTGRMTKSENMVYVNKYDNINAPTTYTETVTGRLFDSVHGFVDVTTVTPLLFSDATQTFPNGGVLQLRAGGRQIHATAFSSDRVKIALDLDNVAGFETVAFLGWQELSGPLGADLGDSDSDGMHNSWETANSTANDPAADTDGDGFSNLSEYFGGGNPSLDNVRPNFLASRFTVTNDVSDPISDTEMPGRTAVASDGTNYLLVSCRQYPSAAIFGTLVSDGGPVLSEFVISTDSCPQRTAAAYDGSDYLVVLIRSGQVFGIRVRPSGTVPAPAGFAISAAANANSPAIACDGTNCLVVWSTFDSGNRRIQAALVTPGDSVTELPVTSGPGGSDLFPRVAFATDRYLVAWTHTTSGQEDVAGHMVSTTGALLLGQLGIATSSTEKQFLSGIAFDGTNFLVTWDDFPSHSPTQGRISGGRVVAASGALLDGPAGFQISMGTSQAHSSSVAFVGSSFVVTWAEGAFPNAPPAGVYAARVSTDGARVDGMPHELGVPISGPPPPQARFVHPVAASRGPSGLIVWVNNVEGGDLKDILAASVFGP